MDRSLWIGIGLGGLISLIASIVANFSHSKIVAYLDDTKPVFQHRRRKKAWRLHKIITELHDGIRDRYFYVARLNFAISAAFSMAITSTISGLTILALSTPPTIPLYDSLPPDMYLRIGFIVSILFIGSFSIFILRFIMEQYITVTFALEQYEKYIADFEAKWGKHVP